MNYHFPAEWHKQQAILITWPDEQTIWHDYLDRIEPFYVEFAHAILQFEPAVIICRNAEKQTHIEQLLQQKTPTPFAARFFQTPYNDVWIRDYGPLTLLAHKKAVWSNFSFNAWGAKYPGELDNQVAHQLHKAHYFENIDYQGHNLILEGGAIETDGEGTLLTTPCIFTSTRNPELNPEEILTEIKRTLNLKRIIVIEHGLLSGDDTDGHVDTLVRFCSPHTLAYTSCDDPNDAHYEPLKKMRAQIEQLTDLNGKPYTLIPLPIPAAKFDDSGRRLPASYANFLIVNGAVLCPTYDDPNDKIILERLKLAFPDRKIVAIPSLPLVQYNGALHCASMQIPSV